MDLLTQPRQVDIFSELARQGLVHRKPQPQHSEDTQSITNVTVGASQPGGLPNRVGSGNDTSAFGPSSSIARTSGLGPNPSTQGAGHAVPTEGTQVSQPRSPEDPSTTKVNTPRHSDAMDSISPGHFGFWGTSPRPFLLRGRSRDSAGTAGRNGPQKQNMSPLSARRKQTESMSESGVPKDVATRQVESRSKSPEHRGKDDVESAASIAGARSKNTPNKPLQQSPSVDAIVDQAQHSTPTRPLSFRGPRSHTPSALTEDDLSKSKNAQLHAQESRLRDARGLESSRDGSVAMKEIYRRLDEEKRGGDSGKRKLRSGGGDRASEYNASLQSSPASHHSLAAHSKQKATAHFDVEMLLTSPSPTVEIDSPSISGRQGRLPVSYASVDAVLLKHTEEMERSHEMITKVKSIQQHQISKS